MAIAKSALAMGSAGTLLILILCSICMLFWMFRNYQNSIALAGTRLKYSAGEATGGLVIPIVSFFQPYLAVLEMAKIAKDRLNWASIETPVSVHLWWLFNIAAIAVSLITLVITFSIAEPLRSYIWSYTRVLVYIFAVFKNLFLIRIVLLIWDGGRQRGQAD
jgi:hypothetical protein